MRFEAGFVREFISAVEALDPHVRSVAEGVLSLQALVNLMQQPVVTTPTAIESPIGIIRCDESFGAYASLGNKLLSDGTTAICLLGGGTPRSGAPTDPMLRVPVLETNLITMKLMNVVSPGSPLFVVVNPLHYNVFAEAFLGISAPGIDPTFVYQDLTYVLSPMNTLLMESDGFLEVDPQLLTLGTGNAAVALSKSEHISDVKRVVFMNMNNIAARPIPEVVGYHVATGNDVTCQVVDRENGDSGGSVMFADGKLLVVEDASVPGDVKLECNLLNTNTFVVNTDILMNAHQVPWRYERRVIDVNGSVKVVYRSNITQLFEHAEKVGYVHMPRDTYQPFRGDHDVQDVTRFMLARVL